VGEGEIVGEGGRVREIAGVGVRVTSGGGVEAGLGEVERGVSSV
jgi:hypothetical protein